MPHAAAIASPHSRSFSWTHKDAAENQHHDLSQIFGVLQL
jgi:hypothetical protein